MTDYNVNWNKAPHILMIMAVDTQENNKCSVKIKVFTLNHKSCHPTITLDPHQQSIIPPKIHQGKKKNDLAAPLRGAIPPCKKKTSAGYVGLIKYNSQHWHMTSISFLFLKNTTPLKYNLQQLFQIFQPHPSSSVFFCFFCGDENIHSYAHSTPP